MCIAFLFSYYYSLAQYNFIEMKFQVGSLIPFKHFELNVFCKEEKYFITVQSVSINKHTEMKDTLNTIHSISKNEFDMLTQMALSISSKDLLNGMNFSELYITHDDGIVSTLNINSSIGEEISYSIVNPMTNTQKRNLTTYLHVFREALLLAKLNPNKILQ